MSGVSKGEVEHKVSLYADDLLLFVSDPVNSIPPVLTLLSEFGLISGYKLNYLGVQVTKCFADLFHHNFSPLLSRLTKDFHRWSLLPLSLAGRINCVKMNVLPKFLYLFQCIPIFIPKSFFVTLDSSISQFIWNGKTPKIRKSVLQKPRHLGGLALPNFQFYYWAENIQSMLHWINSNNFDSAPTWFNIESASCKSSTLVALLCFPITLSPLKYSDNIIVKNSLKIWTF